MKLWPLETHQNGWLPCRKMTLYWTYDWNKISEATMYCLGSSWKEEKHQLTQYFRKYVCFIGTDIVVSYKYATCKCYNLCKAMLQTLGMVIFTSHSVARIKENLHAFVFYKVSKFENHCGFSDWYLWRGERLQVCTCCSSKTQSTLIKYRPIINEIKRL